MEKKTRPAGATIAVGALVSLCVYVGLLLPAAALLVRGAVGERMMLPLVLVCALVASFVGGMVCVRRCPWGRMACGLVGAAAFGAVVVGAAAALWREGAAWVQTGGPILCAIVAGGALAGMLGRRRGKRVKRPVRRRL